MTAAIDLKTPVIGAALDIDLAAVFESDEATQQAAMDTIYQALIDHLVVFLEDQGITPAQHIAFARRFGSLDLPHPVYQKVKDHPEITELENHGEQVPDTNDWHTDLTFRDNPPFMSVLYAIDVPATGGDTLWANMYAAYEALPGHMQSTLSELSAIHDIGTFRNNYLSPENDTDAVNRALAETGSAVHPIVQTHPVTGRKFLYVNRSFTQHVVGMLKGESDRLLQYLYGHIDQPEFQVRYRWHRGSIAMWDNRVTQHYAIADYLPNYRKMHRVTVVDDVRLQA